MRSAHRLIVVPFLLLLCLFLASTGTAGAAPLTWSAPQPIDDQPPFRFPANLSVSCPTASLCVGIDYLGNVLTSSNPNGGAGTWTTVNIRESDWTNGFTSLACPSSSLCVAVDGSGHVATSTVPTGGKGAWTIAHVSEGLYFGSVTCPTTNLCLATGGGESDGDLAYSTDPAGGASTWHWVHVGDGVNLQGIDCASASLCVATEESGAIHTSTNPTGGAASWSETSLPGYAMLAVACPAASLCVVGTGTGVLTSSNPTGGPAAWTAAGIGQVRRLACPSASLCVGLQFDHIVSSTNPTGGVGAWNTSAATLSNSPSRSISCPTTGFCVAALGTEIARSTNPTDSGSGAWTKELIDPNGMTGLTSMACPTSGLCLVGDEFGHILTSTDPTAGPSAWNRIKLTSPMVFPPEIKGISCPSNAFCVAVGGNYIFTSTDPTSAASWTQTQIPFGYFTGVACPSAALCVAVESGGNVVTSTNPTGGPGAWQSAFVDPGAEGWSTIGGPTVACPSASLCLATNFHSGNVASSTNPTGGAAAWSLASLGEGIGGVSCPTSDFCAITDGGQQLWTSSNPAGPAAAWSPSKMTAIGGMALSCPSATFCAAGGYNTSEENYNVAVTSNPAGGGGTTWKGSNTHPGFHGSNHTLSVECPSTRLCLLGDPHGNLYVGTPSGEEEGGGPTPPPPPPPSVTPPVTVPPPVAKKPKPKKPLKCRKGFKKKTVQGKAKCGKVKKKRRSRPSAQTSAAAKLPFKPGHFIGTTSQKCPEALAASNDCEAGSKLPISFTLSKKRVRDVEVQVVVECEDRRPPFIYELKTRRAFDISASAKRGFFLANNFVIKNGANVTNDNVLGKVKGAISNGELEALVLVDAAGRFDSEGTFCNARDISWHATLQSPSDALRGL